MCIPGSGIDLASQATGIKPLALLSPGLALLNRKKKPSITETGALPAGGR